MIRIYTHNTPPAITYCTFLPFSDPNLPFFKGFPNLGGENFAQACAPLCPPPQTP